MPKGCPECGSLIPGKHKRECSKFVRPDAEHAAKISALTDELKKDLTPLFEKYSEKYAQLAKNHDDPHTPVVGVLQLTLAQCAAEYITAKGVMANIAAEMVMASISNAMRTWARALLANAEEKRTVLHKDGPGNVQ